MNGASGAENTSPSTASTNSLIYGHSRQDTVFEYLQEVQVRPAASRPNTAARSAASISAVTKSGGNMFQARPTTTSAEALSAPARSTPGAQTRRRPTAPTSRTRAEEHPERDRRLARRPDPEGPAVLLRLRLAALLPAHQRLPSRAAPSRSTSSRRRPSASFGKLTYSDAPDAATVSVCARRRSRPAPCGYDGTGPNSRSARWPAMRPTATRLRAGPDQHSGNVDFCVERRRS